MIPRLRNLVPPAILAIFCISAVGWAEAIFPVNGPGTGNWVFDQPSVAVSGTVLHLAFVGDNTAGGNHKVYYAAVNGAADFTSKATVPSQVVLTSPVPIDNGSLYSDARHPQIAIRSANEYTILFQAIPSDDPGAGYKLFRALVSTDNHVVASHRVDEVLDAAGGRLGGRLTDPSFALVASDNTMRVAFSSFPSMTDPERSDVYYARVGLDNCRIVGDPILLTKTASTTGTSPLPRLRLEGTTRSHIAWAANPPGTAPSDIYYGLVKEGSTGVDNLAIGATIVLGNRPWGFPNVLLPGPGRVLVLAGEESGIPGVARPVGVALLNPNAVTHDGNPVGPGNQVAGGSFFVYPPGGNLPLSETFSAYHPEASLDGSNRVHVAGYGAPYGASGTPGSYYSMSLLGVTATTGNLAELLSPRVFIGGSDPAAYSTSIGGDYTRPAFVHFSGKAVHFWSGQDNTVSGARNLYVTSTVSSTDPPVPVKQSGCSMVVDAHRGGRERIPGTVLLLLPAAVPALRKGIRKALGR